MKQYISFSYNLFFFFLKFHWIEYDNLHKNAFMNDLHYIRQSFIPQLYLHQ